ncbi:hypothetical protein [Rubinisphaera sp.]|uniref:hypothetical protein n=1 Tax=Rubinisphaera sp. TaxID=2024857 RepID=UPI000C0D8665|nr:hypothetical protein [Rubinisphaera sp.]MBV12013.1 hypothetical protein [Rubinisphaera sp.]HCS51957.1 hypothetical protein [Planctomycetaceae bacterium]|tara:strand:+ start:9565 stop:9963 length:399 start_codon:yes stop_codon:yes gene_type:complete
MVQQSYVGWMLSSLGIFSLLIPLATLISLAMILTLLMRSRGSMSAAAIISLVPVPFLLGMIACFNGAIEAFQVIALSTVSPKPADLADGISTSLMGMMAGLLFTVPTLLLAILGCFFRAMTARPVEVRAEDF